MAKISEIMQKVAHKSSSELASDFECRILPFYTPEDLCKGGNRQVFK